MPDPAKLTGKLGRAVEQVRTAIANSAYFQTWTGSADATAALDRIHSHYVLAADATFPYVIVEQGEEMRIQRAAVSTFNTWVSGEINIVFCDLLDTDTYATSYAGRQAAFMRFWNDVYGKTDSAVTDSYDGVMTQLEASIAVGTYVGDIVQAIKSNPPEIFSPEGSHHEDIEFQWVFTLELQAPV